MPQPKRFTDAELRARKNARSKERYFENLEASRARALAMYYQRKERDPGYLQEVAKKAAERRAADPATAKDQAKASRQRHQEKRQEEVREWFANNPEKRRVYQANRRAKIRSVGGVLSADIVQKLMERQRGKCACCQDRLGKAKSHLDHIIPLALDGANSDDNVQLLCPPCNGSKHSKHPVEFMQSRGFLL